jgi:hypothetical protein
LSKSRRGYLAAALAVSVAGALGVAWTLNANADQIAPAPTAAATGKLTPPALLPWGAKPAKIRTGRAGTGSDTLRSQGLAAAPDDGSASTQPRGRYAPKGRSGPGTFLRSESTDVTPPRTVAKAAGIAAPEPTATESSPSDPKAFYYYNVGAQQAATDGVYANITVARPKLATADYHTLAELAAQSADGKQIVEVGWSVDRVVNGDDNPHLFVFHWINGVSTCYNGCGWEQVSRTVKPGDTLSYGGAKKFGIQYYGGAWWIAFDSEFVGYFPEKLWTEQGVASFSRTGLVQAFGEVASTVERPCSQMGNGLPGTDSGAALMGSVTFLNGPPYALNIRSTTDFYTVNPLSVRTFRYGGPGACT